MLTKITGTLLSLTDERATLGIDAFEYEVLIPEFTRRQLQTMLHEQVSLYTIHYLDGNPNQGRLSPRLVGFMSQIEREFFELVCSVDGVGVRKALRAMVRPVRDVAASIEDQDAKAMSTLPGIGPATADRIIAKLRRKMPKFALLVSQESSQQENVPRNIVEETFQVLCTLGHSEAESRRLLDKALESKKKYKDVEALLQTIYQMSHE